MENLRASMVSRIRPAQTPAEELRQILTRLEGQVGQIGRREKAAAAETLDLLDQAVALIKQITTTGGDLAAENTRYNTITRQFDRKKAAFLEDIGGAQVLQQLRATRVPEEEDWWWHADVRLDEERRLHRTHVLQRAGIAVVVLIILTGLYILFLAPDEATRKRFRHEHDAEQALIDGNPAAAVVEADLALSWAPDDDELLILKGVALELQGETEQAQALYDRAQVPAAILPLSTPSTSSSWTRTRPWATSSWAMPTRHWGTTTRPPTTTSGPPSWPTPRGRPSFRLWPRFSLGTS